MKFVIFISIFFALNTFSCKSSDSNNKIKIEDTAAITNNEVDAEGHTIIIGRIHIGSAGGDHPASSFVVIEDENGIKYSVYPPEIEKELRMYQSRLIKFTVIILDEPQGWGGLIVRRTITPISWEIIRGPPLPKITSLGVIQVTGVIDGAPLMYSVVNGNERWFISFPGGLRNSNTESDLKGYVVTVEGEGIIVGPASLSKGRFSVDTDTISEEERDSLVEFGGRRELRNARILQVHFFIEKQL